MARYAIILDRTKAAERQAVQEIIKTHAKGWWHRFEAVWIVTSHDAKYWRTMIQPVIAGGPSSVLVLRLADAATTDRWAYFGPASRFKSSEWIPKHLPRTTPTGQLPRVSPARRDSAADEK
jgi:hypothetical protein